MLTISKLNTSKNYTINDHEGVYHLVTRIKMVALNVWVTLQNNGVEIVAQIATRWVTKIHIKHYTTMFCSRWVNVFSKYLFPVSTAQPQEDI
jgi:hypothetical protein